MKLTSDKWNFEHLKVHLQGAVDLEFWTIPFYLSAMYSIKDKSSESFQLIKSVVNQEMLHLQSAANIANAFGFSPIVGLPVYRGTTIPHLDFSLDNSEKIKLYLPYSAEIGPLDLKHINAMCLVEIPDYEAHQNVPLHSKMEDYGSIGAFYEALRQGASHFKQHIKGGEKQIDFFAEFYGNAPKLTITESRDKGLSQVNLLIDLITDQGEGQSKVDETIPKVFQNTRDDISPEDDHFNKFNQIKNSGSFPETFPVKLVSKYTKEEKAIEADLINQFDSLRGALQGLFHGESSEQFFRFMEGAGNAIRNCWENGVTPKFG